MMEIFSIILAVIVTIGFIIIIQLQKRLVLKYFKDVDFTTDFLLVALFTLVYGVFVILFLKTISIYTNLITPSMYNFLYEPHFGNIFISMLKAFILNSILYTGYIFQLIYKIESIETRPFVRFLKDIIYGPFIEEVIYRGIIFNILIGGGNNELFSALLSSLLFGISHSRHLLDYLTKNIPISDVIYGILFQCTFTSVFGLYTTYVYIYSKCIYASIFLHSYCNLIGLPRFRYLRFPSITQNFKNVISVLYFVGIISFFVYFSRIMENDNK